MILYLACHFSWLSIIIFMSIFSFTYSLENGSYEFNNNQSLKPTLAFARVSRENEYPYFVSLLNANSKKNTKSLCSGCLITNRIVISAAHCAIFNGTHYLTYEESKLHPEHSVKVFKSMCPAWASVRPNHKLTKARQRGYTYYVYHKGYFSPSAKRFPEFDVMLLFLDKPYDDVTSFPKLYGCPGLLYNARTDQPIELPCMAIGCGNTERTGFRTEAEDKQADGITYRGLEPLVAPIIGYQKKTGGCRSSGSDYAICQKMNRQGTCQGDSGGPLLYKRRKEKIESIIGVVSGAVFTYCQTTFCGCNKNAGFYVSLYMHKDWIIREAKDANLIFEDCSRTKQSGLSLINFNINSNSQAIGKSRGHFILNLIVIIACRLGIF